MENYVICGIGNVLRGDDAAGPMVIEKLGKRDMPPNAMLLDCGPAPENFAGKIIAFNPGKIIIVDAVDMNRPAGEVAEIPLDKIRSQLATTHSMPVTFFIEFLQRNLPGAEIVFIGVQKSGTAFGGEMSMECKAALERIEQMILKMMDLV